MGCLVSSSCLSRKRHRQLSGHVLLTERRVSKWPSPSPSCPRWSCHWAVTRIGLLAVGVREQCLPSPCCQPEQETRLELISPSGGNAPEHLEDTNIWKISLSSDKCAGHSIQLSPQPTSHASAGSRGVGFSGGCLLIGSKRCQHSFVRFFSLGVGDRRQSSAVLMASSSKSIRGNLLSISTLTRPSEHHLWIQCTSL